MKKTVLTITLALIMGTAAFAQQGDGGALRRSKEYENARLSNSPVRSNPVLPQGFGWSNDAEGTDGGQAPLGGGVAVLLGLGAAYLVGKRRKED